MPLVTGLVCGICSASFDAVIVRKRPRFCSPECRAARMAALGRRYRREGRYPRSKYPRAIFEKACAVCGGTFRTEIEDQKTCGRSCGSALAARTAGPLRAAKARARRERACPVCQRLFVPSRPNAKQRRAGWMQQTCGDRRCMRERAAAVSVLPPMFDLFSPLRGAGEGEAR